MDTVYLTMDLDYQLGVDLVDLARIENLYKRYARRFVNRLLTPEEQKQFFALDHLKEERKNSTVYFEKQIAYLGKRWAAKEAFSKALGCGIGHLFSFQDLSVLSQPFSKPLCLFNKNTLQKHRLANFDLTLSDEKNHIIAFCYIKRDKTD